MAKSIQTINLSTIICQQKTSLSKTSGNLIDHIPSSINLSNAPQKPASKFRDRIFSQMTTLNLFLRQVINDDQSCQKIVMQSSLEKTRRYQSHSSNTAAYCKARSRLSMDFIQQLGMDTGDWLHKESNKRWNWFGRSIKLIDAATVSMPDTKANQQKFPQSKTQKEGIGFPIARISAIISLASGSILDAEIGDYSTSEYKLFLQLTKAFTAGDIVVGDRLYSSYFIVAILQSLGVDCVFKMHASRKYNFERGKKLGKNDRLAGWYKPKIPPWLPKKIYDQMPEKLVMRELEKNGVAIVTTLREKNIYPKNKIVELYFQRWSIELDFRSIKTVMKMDILRCKNPDMVRKEIWMHFLAYNLIRVVMAEAAIHANLAPRQISYKTALQGINYFLSLQVFLNNREKINLYHELIVNLGKHRVGNRPGRCEPRAVKRRPKPLILMTKTRNVLRKELKMIA